VIDAALHLSDGCKHTPSTRLESRLTMNQHQISRTTTLLLPSRFFFPIRISLILCTWDIDESSAALWQPHKSLGDGLSFVRARQEALKRQGFSDDVDVPSKCELTSAPFSGVHCSKAIQNPTADGGSVYRKVESL
jgi:hypothetical protein